MFAQRIARQSNLKNAYFKLASLINLPYQDNMFSKILLLDVIEHITNFEDCLSELRRVLKPGGKLIIITPNYRSLWPVIEYILDTFKITCTMRKQHRNKFIQSKLSIILKRSGLTITSMGSLYYISPFVAVVSQSLAQRIFEREMRLHSILGALLYFVVEK